MSFIIVDGETGEIFDIVENRQLHYLERYFRKFELDVRSRVEYVGMDMYEPYITLVNRIFPNANICFDKFHVVNHIARALLSLIDNKQYIHNNMKYGYNTGIALKDEQALENTIRFIKQMKTTHLDLDPMKT